MLWRALYCKEPTSNPSGHAVGTITPQFEVYLQCNVTRKSWARLAGALCTDSSCICAQALFGNLTLDVIVLTVLYSTAGLGIAIVNDFKSIEGDRQGSLPPV